SSRTTRTSRGSTACRSTLAMTRCSPTCSISASRAGSSLPPTCSVTIFGGWSTSRTGAGRSTRACRTSTATSPRRRWPARRRPRGRLGETGKNRPGVQYGERIVLVDSGLRFPTTDMLGIDLVLPDFSYLRERVDDIEAIVVTHGHEDHLGALPWVLRELGTQP